MRPSLLLGALPLFFALPISAVAQRRPDRNAFVNHKITDTRSLVSEVRSNPAVADRYERHFSMNRQQVLDFLSTLHRTQLAKATRFTIYSVPPNNVVKMHYETLKKGTPIFADSSERTTLVAKCGNPVILGFHGPQPRAVVPPVVPPVLKSEPQEIPDIRPSDVDLTATNDAELPILPEIPPGLLPAAAGLGPVASTLALPAATGSILPYLGLAPLLAPVFGSSGGGGSNIVVFPVPEPASLAALGRGMVALVRRRRKA